MRSLLSTRIAALVAAAGFVVVYADEVRGQTSGAKPDVAPFLSAHCADCHDASTQAGELDLAKLAWSPDDPAVFERWIELYDRVRKGEMPPKDEPQPSPDERAKFVAALDTALHETSAARQRVDGRVVLRRLNRTEYENTLHDLLLIDAPLKDILPEDTSAHGFDTVAEGLRFSQLQIEKYLEAADVALDAAIQLTPAPEKSKRRYSLKDEQEIRRNLDTPAGTQTDKNSRNRHVVTFRELPDAIVMFNDLPYQARFRAFRPSAPGLYRIRASAYGYQSDGAPIPLRIFGDNFRTRRLLGMFDMPADKPREVEFVARLNPNEGIALGALDVGYDARGQGVYNIGAADYTGRGLAVQWVEIEGPLYESWPPPSTKRLAGDVPIVELQRTTYRNGRRIAYQFAPDDPQSALAGAIERFAGRAFRRPLEPGEADRFVRLAVEALAEEGATFESALRLGLRGVLTSPQFLLFDEAPGRLNDYALASRLSYFLWSTMPDDALSAAAAAGRLHDRSELKAEVERMLASPKAGALVKNFAGQWLDLRNIEATTPDRRLYPEFDEQLQQSMVAETEAFFAELIDENLSAANLIDSDFAVVNRRLAEHYDLPPAADERLRRVSLPADSLRGGLLGQASILKVTANGTVTSPVLRGGWVMDRLLNEPPPPPPASVDAIEPDTRGTTTIREQLAKHRSNPSCIACHLKIDPPGFALECFDVIGGARDRYRSQDQGDRPTAKLRGQNIHQYKLGPAVDSSGEFHGQAFAGLEEFKTLLMQRQDQVLRGLASQLVVYGTGAGISFADRRELDAIVRRTKDQGGGVRTLVHEITASELFRTK